MAIEKLEFDGRTVIIDPKNLKFDEATLGIYIQHEAGYYDPSEILKRRRRARSVRSHER